MKFKNTAFALSLPILGIAAFMVGSSLITEEAQYMPRKKHFNDSYFKNLKGIDGAMEFYFERKKNLNTGKIEFADVLRAEKQVAEFAKQQKSGGSLGLDWIEMGPDNVGGRTRALLVDKDNTARMYAGSVSGGLWISNTYGYTWSQFDDFMDDISIACIVQAPNGDIYFGTGESFTGGWGVAGGSSGGIGRGVWKSTDGGTTFEQLTSTIPSIANSNGAAWAYVNRLAVDPVNSNLIYAGTNNGLQVSNDGGQTWDNPICLDPPACTIFNNGSFQDVQAGTNGTILAANNGSVYRLGAGATDFENITSNFSGLAGASRIEIAFSPSDPNYIYACATSGNLHNLYQSTDNGVSWDIIVPGGGTAVFGDNQQGSYDLAVGVFPDDPEHILVGGVELFGWSGATNVWDMVALTGWQGAGLYVHADKHAIVFPSDYDPVNNPTYYIGTDGGIFASYYGGQLFTELNTNYNVTQFYAIGVSREGWVAGGTQDNGNPFIDFTGNSVKAEKYNLPSGDGGFMQFSVINPDAFFWESQNGNAKRSPDKGSGPDEEIFIAICGECEDPGPWVTPLMHWESFNDLNSQDSIQFVADKTYSAGETIFMESNNNEFPFKYVTPVPLAVNDTILVQDIVQSKFFAGLYSGVWMSKDVLDFSKPPRWYKLSNLVATSMEFSKDGDILYIGTSGSVYRISGILGINSADAYTYNDSDNPIVPAVPASITETQIFSNAQNVCGIGVDPNNSENVVVACGNFGYTDYVYRSTNAASATGSSGTFVSIQSNLPAMPVYDGLIEMSDNNRIIIGTEYGVYATDNGFDNDPNLVVWTDENTNMSRVPTYMIVQQNHANNSCTKVTVSGNIYIGTHGRGIFRSEDYAVAQDSIECDLPITSMSKIYNAGISAVLFPNPVMGTTCNLEISLIQTEYVRVKIFDISGKLISDLDQGKMSKGKHILEISTAGFDAGTYFINISSDMASETKKLLVL